MSLGQEKKRVAISYKMVTEFYTDEVTWEQKPEEGEGVILWPH